MAVAAFRLWLANPRAPIVDANGDYLFGLGVVKTVVVHGSYLHVPELGAPFGLNLYDFPEFFSDFLHFGLIKSFSIVS